MSSNISVNSNLSIGVTSHRFRQDSDNGEEELNKIHWEGGVVISLGILGAVGNFICVIVLICITKCRTVSLAIFGHHCFLDFLKSLYCFPYGWNTIFDQSVPFCRLVGSSYVLITTTSAYNLLALVVNEEYAAFSTNQGAGDLSCVIFGVVFVWFTSFLLNLGVSLIPANTYYIDDVHACMFVYGKPESYVLHILWIGLVTCAIVLSFKIFYCSYRRISFLAKRSKWDALHKSLSQDIHFHSALDQITDNQAHYQFHSRRILVYISLVTSFALFWYPLFLLTIVDFQFSEPKVLYKALTVFAWSHPLLTPVFCFLVVRDLRNRERLIRDLSSNHFHLKARMSRLRRYKITEEESIRDFTVENDHFNDLINSSNEMDGTPSNLAESRPLCSQNSSVTDAVGRERRILTV